MFFDRQIMQNYAFLKKYGLLLTNKQGYMGKKKKSTYCLFTYTNYNTKPDKKKISKLIL